MPTSLSKSPVAPLMRNATPDETKRAVDSRTKSIPIPRIVPTRVAAGKSRSLSDRYRTRGRGR